LANSDSSQFRVFNTLGWNLCVSIYPMPPSSLGISASLGPFSKLVFPPPRVVLVTSYGLLMQ